MGESAGRDRPCGSCPRCGRALVRERLPLQDGPLYLAMEGPPACPSCSAQEVEEYLELWGPPPPDEDQR
ncbi:hypothetical protein [Streptomyces tateyamensis]|uniref:hypothetical protein n=1 Tax=Streptomyces tateyamensis TaxID=565073 RepID=UPI0011B3E0D7|nr:hypothetical protein [Streptomyces tateyamensis]